MASVHVLCRIHKSEDVIFYCDDCEILVCRDCLREEHQQHSLLKFKEKVEESKVCLKDNLETLTNLRLPKLRENLNDVVSLKDTKEQDNQEMISKIVERADKMIEKINLIRDRLMDRCELLNSNNIDAIEKKIFQIETRIDIFEKAEAFGLGAMEHGQDAEIIHEDLELRRQLHHYQPIDLYDDIDRPLFINGDLSEIALKQMFGTVTSEIRDLSKEDNKRPALKVKKIGAFSYGLEDIVGVCPVSRDVAWLHQRKGSKNIMVNMKGNPMFSLDFGFVVTSFTPSNNGTIYMTDYSTNRIYSMETSRKINMEITMSLHPIGICVCNNGDILISVTDEWIYNTTTKSQRKVIRMTKDFKEKEVFELDELGDNIFTLPIAVAENLNNDICILDKTASDNGRLCVLFSTGKIRFIYQHPGAKQPFDPSAVCCTKYSNIVVTDPANNAVEIISEEGEFLHFLATEKGGCSLPLSLGKDQDDKIWIGCGKGKGIILRYGYGLPR